MIFGDDIGWFNPSIYHHGLMGYRTPNIDRIGREGAMFTDWYGQQSCTAGRAAFITGQSPIRTGLTKVGLPGADVGLRAEDPTIAEVLKPLGYATGQFGKNHLGDRDEFLPTNHGFDEFYNEIFAHEDFLPTLAAAGGDNDVGARCRKSCQSGKKQFKVHLDGYNLIPFFRGEAKAPPRNDFMYWSDDGDLLAMRVGDMKIAFKQQENTGIGVWTREFTWLQTFKEFPIRQKPASFNLDSVMEKLSAPKQ